MPQQRIYCCFVVNNFVFIVNMWTSEHLNNTYIHRMRNVYTKYIQHTYIIFRIFSVYFRIFIGYNCYHQCHYHCQNQLCINMPINCLLQTTHWRLIRARARTSARETNICYSIQIVFLVDFVWYNKFNEIIHSFVFI